MRKALELLFSLRGFEVASAGTPEAALAAVRAGGVGVVVQDMNFSKATTSGEEGAALFRGLRALDPGLPVLLMTAWTSLEMAVELVREGAADYVAKPWDDERLLRRVQTLLRARELAGDGHDDEDAGDLIAHSPAMRALVRLATKVARADVPVLITGPNGAGKEKIAELVQARSTRQGRPFVKVNVGALPDDLLEAELFGAEAGAFTGAKSRAGRFEAADGGTLFLDELGTLSLEGQAKLLRVLQTGELQRLGSNATRKVDVRVVAATNADLRAAIAEGRFREDLFYRLAVIELEVPPLADRPEDVLPLAEAFLGVFRTPGCASRFAEDAIEALLAHSWPGNVRELSNAIRRALLVAEGEAIHATELALRRSRSPAPTPRAPQAPPLDAAAEAERARVQGALREADYVVAQAAATLGLSRQALYRRMRRLGITLERRIG